MAPTTRSRKRQPDEDGTPQQTPSSTTKASSKRQRKLPVRTRDADDEDEDGQPEGSSALQPSLSMSTPATGTLKVFGDDDENELAPKRVKASVGSSTVKPAQAQEESDSDDSDDDAAPEAVSTTQAASAVKKSAKAAQKAAQEQAAAEKLKRQQRDALFKQQAEERKVVAAAAGRVAEANAEDETAAASRQPVAGARKRTDRVHVPNVLPAEFLTDDSSSDEDEGGAATAAHQDPRAKRRKVADIEEHLARQNRAPRDVVVGSTAYRVAKKQDERMAPKVSRSARGTKNALLKRSRPAVKPRGGFVKQ